MESTTLFFFVKCKSVACFIMLALYTNLAPFLSFAACFFQTRGQEWNPLKSPCDAEKLSLLFFEWAQGCCCF